MESTIEDVRDQAEQKKPKNPPAFPHIADGGYTSDQRPGMTLRDYLAAHVLGFIHIADAIVCHGADGASMESWNVLAEDAYAAADAMLRARG